MSDFKINSIATKQGQHGPVIAGVSTVNSTGCMKIPSGPTEFRGGRGRGVVAGGSSGAEQNIIQLITIATAGNATDFGDLTVTRRDAGGVGSSVRGVFSGGGYPSPKTTIDYVTFSSSGGANDFGEYGIALFQASGASDNVRGIFAGGVKPSPTLGYNAIEFITIATTGDSTEFGNLSSARWGAAGVNSPTRAIFAAGATPTYIKSIEFVTIATLGDSQDFGEVSTAARNIIPACSSTRGVFAGGQTSTSSPYGYVNTIEFITIATFGNTSDFGDLTLARSRGAGLSNNVRGVFSGGAIEATPATTTNIIDFITIASTGNATDFGDLSLIVDSLQGASDSHGGIGE